MTLLIKGARVVRNDGGSAEWLDVFVTGEKISAIGNFPAKPADEVIDGQGCYLAPGFIDVNTESDHYLSLFDHPAQEDLLKQGITTIIGGQEGASLAPLLYGTLESLEEWSSGVQVNVNWHTMREFLAALEKPGIGLNFATLVGHSTVRRAIAGEDPRELTKNELAVFSRILHESIDAGAFGLSTGLKSAHGRKTPYAEIKTLVGMVAKAGCAYTTSLRKGSGLDTSVDEIVRIARETGAKTVISNFLPIRGQSIEYERALEKIEGLSEDANVRFDITPFETSVRPLYRFLPDWAQTGGLQTMQKNVEDRWLRERIVKELRIPASPDDFVIAKAVENGPLVGQSLRDLMAIYGLKKPEEALVRLMLTTRLRALVQYRNIDMKLLGRATCHPRSFIASKGLSVSGNLRETILKSESASSTFPRFLSFVTQEKLMSLEAAIHKITAEPARFFGIEGRGEIREGCFADLTGIAPRGEQAVDIPFVIVNGRIAYRDGAYRNSKSGKVLRKQNRS